jgi:hypothetical protein
VPDLSALEADLEDRPVPVDQGRGRSGEQFEEFLLEDESARLLRLSPRTMQRHRQAGTGPPYRRLGGLVVYARTELLEWADSCRWLSTAAPARPREPNGAPSASLRPEPDPSAMNLRRHRKR